MQLRVFIFWRYQSFEKELILPQYNHLLKCLYLQKLLTRKAQFMNTEKRMDTWLGKRYLISDLFCHSIFLVNSVFLHHSCFQSQHNNLRHRSQPTTETVKIFLTSMRQNRFWDNGPVRPRWPGLLPRKCPILHFISFFYILLRLL